MADIFEMAFVLFSRMKICLVRKLETVKNYRKSFKFKMNNLKKEKVLGFDQPLFRANFTADRIPKTLLFSNCPF
jgi:hypothetical protein